jgi:hypothetical protein
MSAPHPQGIAVLLGFPGPKKHAPASPTDKKLGISPNNRANSVVPLRSHPAMYAILTKCQPVRSVALIVSIQEMRERTPSALSAYIF